MRWVEFVWKTFSRDSASSACYYLQVQLLLAVLQNSTFLILSSSPCSPSLAPALEVVRLCLEGFVLWASSSPCITTANRELAYDLLHSAAHVGNEACYHILSSANGQSTSPPYLSAAILYATLHLWVQNGRIGTLRKSIIFDRHIYPLILTWPATLPLLLTAGIGPWKGLLQVLLLDFVADEEKEEEDGPRLQYRIVLLCLEAVARTSALWAWDALAEVLMKLPESEEGEEEACMRREQATLAVLYVMQDNLATWRTTSVAVLGAIALLSGDLDDDRLWKQLFALVKDFMAVITKAAGQQRTSSSSNSKDEEHEKDIKTALLGFTQALIMLGQSSFCTRSFESESRIWAKEWGSCLSILLCLSLEDAVVYAAAGEARGSQGRRKEGERQQHQLLAQALCEKCLVQSKQWGKAITGLFKASDAAGQAAALKTLRAYARNMSFSPSIPSSSFSSSASTQTRPQQQSPSYGLLLILQACLVLGDPTSAAIASTEQVIWTFESLEAASGLVPMMLTNIPAATTTTAGGASPSSLSSAALETILVQASSALQAVLEEDGEEAWLKEARDWVMKKLQQQAQQQHKQSQLLQQQYEYENRTCYLIHLAFSLCIATRRPAPHAYVADLTKFLLDQVLSPPPSPSAFTSSSTPSSTIMMGKRIQAQAHKCLRSLISNPNLLAYRAGRKEHWDEARRRVTATYIKVCTSFEYRLGSFTECDILRLYLNIHNIM